MTKMLDQAIEKVRQLSDAEQDEAAEMLLSVAARRGPTVKLDDSTRAAIREGREQARRGEFASDEEMAELFRSRRAKARGE
jgi:predicted transcriptional regulator